MARERNHNIKILITGGHLTPALAVISELKKRGYSDFLWVGRKKTMWRDRNPSAEFQKINQELKIPFFNFTSGKIIRFYSISSFFEFLLNLVLIPIGFIESIFLFCTKRVSLVVSFGGYMAVPIVIYGKLFGKRVITHEQTCASGMANRIVGKFADKVLISWADSAQYFDKSKVILTGNPLRQEVLHPSTYDFKIDKSLPTIYITGGNQGAHVINIGVFPLIQSLIENFNVIHQTGSTSVTGDFAQALKLQQNLNKRTRGHYVVKDNIFGPEIGEIFALSDILITRAGANIVTEILALAKLAILIPIPWSINNEQLKNARLVEKTGLGEIIEEKNLTSAVLLKAITKASGCIKSGKDLSGGKLAAARKSAPKLVHLDAAEKIVDEILK